MKQIRLLALVAFSVMSLSNHVVHGQSQAEQSQAELESPLAAVSPLAATIIPPFSVCSRNVNIASLLPGGAHEDPDVMTAVAFITLTEQTLLQEVAQASSLDQYHQITLLGKTEIYDVNLSPLKNIACATCHVPYTGFRGSSSVFNATTAAQPGGVPITNATPPEPNWRISPRNPQSYAESPGDGKYRHCMRGLESVTEPICFTDRNYLGRSIVRDYLASQCGHCMRQARSTPCERSTPGTSEHC